MLSVPTGAIIAAAIAFFGAVVGALVAYVGLLISKETKISEFRQAWIDALRVDISDLVGKLVTTYENDQQDDAEQYRANLSVATLRTRILLRLNVGETEHDALIAAIDKLHEFANSMVPPPNLDQDQKKKFVQDKTPHLMAFIKTTTAASQALLKKEWERVKAGEPVYRDTQRYARGAFIAVAFAAPLIVVFCFWLMLIASAVCGGPTVH